MTPRPSDGGEDARVARTRADVARAALTVLVEEDGESITHAHVAEIAGYSKTTLYTHWPSKVDLIALALEDLGDLPHHEPTGDLRFDLIGELTIFRQAVTDLRLDKVLSVMAQWSSVDEMRQIRDTINTSGQRVVRAMLAERFEGAALEASLSMLAGVVACPTLMFGVLPGDDVIEAAVDIVLRGAP